MRKSETRRKRIAPALRDDIVQRLPFMLSAQKNALSRDDLIDQALRFYDRALCAQLEGAKIRIHHRDGSVEEFTPCSA